MMESVDEYLRETEIINWKHPEVLALAHQLANNASGPVEIAKHCFEWVRDEIKHSHDYHLNPVTCRASDVLVAQTGYCYAKSHLLAALLRANHIPTGFCYQRLTIDDNGPPYCLHGLNAIFLPEFDWYRVDARGNKQGVNAQFTPPAEQLAFLAQFPGEADLPEIWTAPLPVVVETLQRYQTWEDVLANLPDIPIIG